ncbi:MAG: class I SAM-dependent methyltransferase [Minwuia sp.]|uniref:class I SAM-dependent methyltransferase n=1 Tax=Minwuia sp. TaxID=2493630 RepID=UPI003A870495
MTTAAAFWDKVAAKYAKSPVKNVRAYEQTLERTRSYLGPEARVLEIGCGTGTTALKLADAAGHITATDISGEMIVIAEAKRLTEGVSNVEFATTDSRAAGEGGYDAVLAFNLLHLLEDPAATVRHAREMLKPGGVFISKTMCLAEASVMFRPMIFIMQLLGKAPHVGFFRAGRSGEPDRGRGLRDRGGDGLRRRSAQPLHCRPPDLTSGA